MSDFFRFPHTPHLAWLGEGEPRGDKLLDPAEVTALLADDVLIEEKIDGANLGISRDGHGQIRVQNRGAYLEPPFRGQFSRLRQWLMPRLSRFQTQLPEGVILFGEWCAARHSLPYERLPDWFLVFDIYNRKEKRFWSRERRQALVTRLGLAGVPLINEGHYSVDALTTLLQERSSAYRDGAMEGLVIRQDSHDWCKRRAKLVHPDFLLHMGEHWRLRPIEWNTLSPSVLDARTTMAEGTAHGHS